jgi:mRNA interferase RelE/StbE
MTYKVMWTRKALHQLDKIDKEVQKRMIERIESVLDDPLSSVKRLKGFNLYSLRVGDYRMILSIENRVMIVIVLDVGHRSTVYKNF